MSYNVRISEEFESKANDLAVELIQETGDSTYKKRDVIEAAIETGFQDTKKVLEKAKEKGEEE